MGGSGGDSRVTFGQTFVAAGLAGVVARTVTSPLDVVKTVAQVGTADSRGGFLDTFRQLYRHEGWRAFWKGNVIACLRIFPYNAVQLAVFDQWKQRVHPADGRMSPPMSLLAGSVAGVAAVLTTYPLDMVKTRLTLSHTDKQKATYRGIAHAFRVIQRDEGLRAFFRGTSLSVVGVIPFAGSQFMVYEMLRAVWDTHSQAHLTPAQSFVNGCIAAAFGQTFSYPIDTIRKKLQAQSLHGAPGMHADVQFSGTLDAFRQTVRQYGLAGLWRGTVANLVKLVPYSGLMFAVYESARRVFLYHNGFTESPWSERPRPGIPQSVSAAELRAYLHQHPAH